jgi:hypothetical protein
VAEEGIQTKGTLSKEDTPNSQEGIPNSQGVIPSREDIHNNQVVIQDRSRCLSRMEAREPLLTQLSQT